ncbi:Outer cell wall protein precursor [compost metagenome]
MDKVSASNLKEVVVAFDGTVDKDTAENKGNYTLKSGKTIKSAALSDDKKTVTLTLDSKLTNNKVEFLSVANVKAGNSTISAKEFQFTVADNELPEVKEVKSLGTKAIKVTFSEPVVTPLQANFELDGNAYYGNIKELNSRTFVLTPYSGALSVADHKLVVKNVKDFADFVSLTSVHEFKVVEDTTAPTISEATATLEYVTLTFSEEVDPDTFDKADVYWKSSGSKKESSKVEQVTDNKYKFFFTDDNQLPTGALTIYVQDVADFSGNKIAADTTVTVTPEVDVTRPEVTKAEVTAKNEIEVTFNKALNATEVTDVDNYTVLDKDGKVLAVSSASFKDADKKIVVIKTYKDLSVGDNKLTIKNLRDNTRLKNTMLDFSSTVVRKDTDLAKVDGNYLVNTTARNVVINFDKKMDIDSITNYNNYYVEYGDGTRKPLTGDLADISVYNNGKAVSIQFAEKVTLGNGTKDVKYLVILSLKDENGNLVNEFVNGTGDNKIDVSVDQKLTFKSAKLVEKKVLELEFNSTITAAPSAAFSVYSATGSTYTVDSVKFDGSNKVKVTLKEEFTDAVGLNVDVHLNQLTTLVGTFSSGTPTKSVVDKVAPEFKEISTDAAARTITLTYSEQLKAFTGDEAQRVVSDFVITRNWDGEKLKTNQYNVAISGKTVVITLADTTTEDSTYKVEFKGSDLIVDNSSEGNKAESVTKTSAKINK